MNIFQKIKQFFIKDSTEVHKIFLSSILNLVFKINPADIEFLDDKYWIYNKKDIDTFLMFYENNYKYISDKYDCDDFAETMVTAIKNKFQGCPCCIQLTKNIEHVLVLIVYFDDGKFQGCYVDGQNKTVYEADKVKAIGITRI